MSNVPKDQGKELTLEQYVSTLRNQIVLSYDSAKELALKNYDDISKRFAEAHNTLMIQAKAESDKKGISVDGKIPKELQVKQPKPKRK